MRSIKSLAPCFVWVMPLIFFPCFTNTRQDKNIRQTRFPCIFWQFWHGLLHCIFLLKSERNAPKTIKFLNRFCLQLHNNDYFSRVYEKVANFVQITLQKVENKQIQAHNYNLSYLLFAFDYIKLSLRLLQGSCFTQTDVNYCFISFLDDDSCARKTGKNNTYKHNWVELFTN